MPTQRHDTYDGHGNLVSSEEVEVPQSEVNNDKVEEALQTAVNVFSATVKNWATLTTAQKDQANLRAQRVLLYLLRSRYNRLEEAE